MHRLISGKDGNLMQGRILGSVYAGVEGVAAE